MFNFLRKLLHSCNQRKYKVSCLNAVISVFVLSYKILCKVSVFIDKLLCDNTDIFFFLVADIAERLLSRSVRTTSDVQTLISSVLCSATRWNGAVSKV